MEKLYIKPDTSNAMTNSITQFNDIKMLSVHSTTRQIRWDVHTQLRTLGGVLKVLKMYTEVVVKTNLAICKNP